MREVKCVDAPKTGAHRKPYNIHLVCNDSYMDIKQTTQMVVTTNHMVAQNVADAIAKFGATPNSVALETGISQTDLLRKLKNLNGSSFTVTNLAVIAKHLGTDVAALFVKKPR